MPLIQPTAEEAAAGIRAMTMVARAPGKMAEPARRLINAAQKLLLHTDYDIDALEPIVPEALAEAVVRPELRTQLVNGMVVLSLAAGAPPPQQVELVRSFAAALDIASPALRLIRHLANHDLLLYKLCMMRNSHMRDVFKDQLHYHGGVTGLIKNVMTLTGVMEDAKLAARYRALEQLPDGTVGKRFWQHYHDNGFGFPGEKGGFPEAGVYHDFTHVLAGYNTTGEGETLVAAFIAGFRQGRPDHGLFSALFGLSLFSAGVNVTPIGVTPRTGAVGNVAEQFFIAIQRGSQMEVDLSDNWNYWEWVEVPLPEARQRLRIAPKARTGPWDYD
jgi:hypothetical protein